MKHAVIVDAARTASGRGKAGGALSGVHPAELLGGVLRELVGRNGIDPRLIDDIIIGCVSQAGDQAMNIARTAALTAGLPESIPATTVDRQCGSSQQAVHFGAQAIMAGVQEIVVAGGIESMSRVVMGSPNAGGDPLAPLSGRYGDRLVPQGISAEMIARDWGFSRADLDRFSAQSHQRAAAAAGAFAREIVPVATGETMHSVDETVRPQTTAESLAGLRSAFGSDRNRERHPDLAWDITPGNSSPLTDGASAVLLMEEGTANRLGLRPRARIHTMTLAGSDPVQMLSGVIPATRKALDRSGLRIDEIDAFEVNEAFAPVPLMWAAEFGADPAKLNPRGGAIALGHPLGASGTRLMTTMLHFLEDTGGRYGLQTMCEGGGQANATIVERLS